MLKPLKYLSLILPLSLITVGCSEQSRQSETKVTDVVHTEVKRQSIGNCWIYAAATWAESLHLAATGETVNLSESYLTYYHWLDQLENSWGSEVQTGGWFRESSRLIRTYGLMLEGDFIPSEAEAQMSLIQDSALDYVNTSLKEGGALYENSSRTRENVMTVLNEAFGVNMESLQDKVISADSLIVRSSEGETATLMDYVEPGNDQAWAKVSYPQVYSENAEVSESMETSRKEILKRVMKALNDKQPVVMAFFVDFNALNPDNGTFDREYFTGTNNNVMGRQGGHMLVLEDYTVDNAPGYGYIGEGLATPEEMEAALEGDVVTLVAKNSWGTDRPERGITDGYTRFTIEYLNEATPQENGGFSSPLWDFHLPAGY